MAFETELLEAYRTSGPEKRLSLFLDHPDLREEFIAIEQAGPRPRTRRTRAFCRKADTCPVS